MSEQSPPYHVVPGVPKGRWEWGTTDVTYIRQRLNERDKNPEGLVEPTLKEFLWAS
jgi:hypothetical protein